jgi:SAM-dependent methyltransferase
MQDSGTRFFRNRPQLELLRRLAERRAKGDTLRVAVVGCSTGAEAYSIAWTVRSARPDLKLAMHAIDVSSLAVETAKSGAYSAAESQLFQSVTDAEFAQLFDRGPDIVTVKPWIREGIDWGIRNAADPDITDALGPQDIVVANNFLCHMDDSAAESCLRNLARLVGRNGYLLVSGVDLDIRTRVAHDLGLNPVQELLEDIHEGDPDIRSCWPFHYAGLEPLNKSRRDWKIRYAAAFQRVSSAEAGINSSNQANSADLLGADV